VSLTTRPHLSRILKSYPEKASIDEAFIDFTRPIRAELLARYPYLGQVPTNAPNGLDTDLPPPPPIFWENRGILIPIDPPSENQAGSSSSHGTGTHAGAEDGDDDPRHTRTWHDVALSIAAELMNEIRAQVRIQLGYTTSAVGIYLLEVWMS
jgi:DNA polymerase eta